MMWLAVTPIAMVLFWWGRREWRLWREFSTASKSNSSRFVREGQKKGPPQAEAEDGHHHHIEYGGHHLP